MKLIDFSKIQKIERRGWEIDVSSSLYMDIHGCIIQLTLLELFSFPVSASNIAIFAACKFQLERRGCGKGQQHELNGYCFDLVQVHVVTSFSVSSSKDTMPFARENGMGG